MKTLAESLFDKDLVSKVLDIEKILKNFDSDSLQELSLEDRNAVFDQIFEYGYTCNATDAKKHPIDLKNGILIARRDRLLGAKPETAEYTCKFVFIFDSLRHPGLNHTFNSDIIKRAALMNWNEKKFYWDCNTWPKLNDKPTWKGKISEIDKFYGGVTFSIIDDKKIAEYIVDGILEG